MPSTHGTEGPVGATLPQVELAIDDIALEAQQELSSEFKFNQDVNAGDMIGFSACFTPLLAYLWTTGQMKDAAC